MSSGATLRIDGDSEGYIAAAERANKATEKVADTWGEVGDHLDRAVGKVLNVGSGLSKINLATIAIGASVAAVGKGYADWTRRIEEAHAKSKEITATLSGGIGHLSPYQRRQAASLDSPLSYQERAEVVSAYQAKRPQASHIEVGEALRSASDAAVAGYDAKRFAATQADLAGFGQAAPDLAARLLKEGGSHAEGMASLMRDVAARSSTTDAYDLLPTLTAAARVPGGIDLVQRAWQTHVEQGRMGPFSEGFRERGATLVPGLGDRATLAAIERERAEDPAPQPTAGYLERQRAQAMRDPLHAGEMAAAAMAARTEIKDTDEQALAGAKRAAADALGTAMARNSGLDKVGISNARFMASFSASTHLSDLWAEPEMRRQGEQYRQVDAIRYDPGSRVVQLLDEQNQLIRSQRRPAVPAGFTGQDER